MSTTTTGPASTGAAAPGGAAGMPDLLYGEAETELRAAVRALFDDRSGWREVLARTETPETYDAGLWRALAAEVGCAGLLIPESNGGAGASYRETAVVAEEAGRAVAPVPYLGSAVVATTALLTAGGSGPSGSGPRGSGGVPRDGTVPGSTVPPRDSTAGDDQLLTGLADGTVTAALAVPFATAPRTSLKPTVRLGAPGGPGGADGGYRLSGTVTGLADALPADVLLVPADGVPYGLYAVNTAEAGVSLVPVVSLDMTRQLTDLTLEDVPGRRVASGEQAKRAVDAALAAGAGVLASELLGTAERCLDITVAYLKERRQFARPIGSFQALKHRVADLWVGVTQARAAARYAAACLATGDPDAPVAVALAKAACSDIAVRAAEECVQLHGGIGFTWEHPAHLYLKRAKSSSIGFGTADRHRASLAGLVNLPAPR